MRRRPTPLLAAGAAALALAGVASSPASASSSQTTIFEAPREMLTGTTEVRNATLDEISAFGVKRMRLLVQWSRIVKNSGSRSKPAGHVETDPASPGYDWTVYDAIFNSASQRGIEVIATVTGSAPRWATARRRGNNYKPDRNSFARFVEAVGKRYGDRVGTWTIWNEPNQPQFLNPQYVKRKPYSPLIYRALYQAALQGLGASGNGGDTILAGETSPAGNRNIVAPVTFAKRFFKGKRLNVDGWAHHPYTKRSGPFYKPAQKVDVTIGALSRLTKALDRHSKHRRLPVYLTEFGIQSHPDRNLGVSVTKQAEYRSIAEKIAYDNKRVRAFSQYLMRDDLKRRDGYSGFESGLRYANGRKKRSYEAFRLPLVADRGKRKVKLWGLVRPAAGATTVTVEFRDKGGWKPVANVATNSRGVWSRSTRFKRGRTYRVRWESFTGPATHVYRAP